MRYGKRPNAAAVAAVVSVVSTFAIPLLHGGAWLYTLAVLIGMLTASSHWALVHEAIHNRLFANRRRKNLLAGRLLSIAFGAPFDVLRFGHLFHHRQTRSAIDAGEFFDPSEHSRLRATVTYYARLLGGLYIAEVIGCVVLWLPAALLKLIVRRMGASVEAASKFLTQDGTLRRARVDGLAAIAFIGAALVAGQEDWDMVVAILAGRALTISMLDNAFHYGAALSGPGSAWNFRAPAWLASLLLNGHLHRIHHRHPSACWTDLPRLFKAEADRCDYRYVNGVVRQLRGPMVHPLCSAGG